MKRSTSKTVLMTLMLLALSATAGAEKGVESYTHIHREQRHESISVTEEKTQSTSSTTSKGTYVKGPDMNSVAIIIADAVDLTIPNDWKTPKELPSYREKRTREINHFYEHGALAVIKDGKKWGIVDIHGKISLPPTYKILRPQKDGLFLAGDKEKNLQYINKDGQSIAAPTRQGPIPYKEQGLYGFKNPDGTVLISPRYKSILTYFQDGIAFVKTMKGEKIAINESGKALFAVPYDQIFAYEHGVAEYRRKVSTANSKNYLAVTLGGLLSGKEQTDFSYHREFSGIKRGFINKEGQIVIDSKNDRVWPMTEYGALVKNDGRLSFVSPDGVTLIPPAYMTPGSMSRRDGLLALQDEGVKKYGVFRMETGEQLIDFIYEDISFLGFHRAYIKEGNKRQLIDVYTGRILADLPVKSKVIPFNDEEITWVYRTGEYYAIIDTDGNIIYEDTKDHLQDVSEFRHGYCVAKKGKKWGIMKADGTWLIPPTYDDANMLS